MTLPEGGGGDRGPGGRWAFQTKFGESKMLISRSFLAALAALLATPAAALAGSSPVAYVDRDDADPAANQCTTPANPCETIAQGLGEVGSGGTVYVDDSSGSYSGGVSVQDGRSLIAQNFAPADSGTTAIESTDPAQSALQVGSGGAGEVSGFTFRGPNSVVDVYGPVELTGNVFDTPGGTSNGDLRIDGFIDPAPAGEVLVEDNTFTDADAGTSDPALANDVGIKVVNGIDPVIRGNSIGGYRIALDIRGGGTDPVIEDNTITRTHGADAMGVFVTFSAHPRIVANAFEPAPAVSAQPNGVGIFVQGGPPSNVPGADLERNTITGFAVGVSAFDLADGDLTLDGDLIHGNSQRALSMSDLNGDPQLGGGAATGVTFADNGGTTFSDILLRNVDLALDSSIVEDPIEVPSGESATCAISFSRGPTTTPGGSGCANFQTSAGPGFADPAARDYHLDPGSAMIDAGNPAEPPAGAVDLDGDARAIDGDGDPACTARRDMGADEFVLAPPSDCAPPATTITAGPANTVKTERRRVRVKFKFESSEQGSTYRCSLDGRAFADCASGDRFAVKAKRERTRYKFAVAAIDPAGNLDPTPAKRKFWVKRIG